MIKFFKSILLILAISIITFLAGANVVKAASNVAAITITPSTNQTITAGQTIQFSAQGYDQYGNPISGLTYTWTGTNSSGLFNSTTVGTHTVYASNGGVNSSVTYVTVRSATSVAAITITPSTNQTITAGQTIQFSAQGYDQYGNPISGLTYTWTGTNTSGLFNNSTVGTYAVYASNGGVNSSVTYVTVRSATSVAAITITPSTNQTITAGQTIQFSAQGYDQYGNPISGLTYTWTGTNASGLFNNSTVGTYAVYATSSGINSPTVFVIVNPGQVASISVYPTLNTNIIPGASLMITATLRDTYGNLVANGTTVNWTRSNTSFVLSAPNSTTTNGVATVTLTAPSSTGVSTTVTATANSISATTGTISTSQSVLTTIVIEPSVSIRTITAGQNIQFTATGYNQFGNPMTGVTFYWENTEHSMSGLFNNSTVGTYIIRATAQGIYSNSVTVTVIPSSLAAITITPSTNQTITAGQTIQFSAQGYDQYGNPISGLTYTWTGTNTSGLFNNSTVGTYAVYASNGGVNSSVTYVTVNHALANSVVISPTGPLTMTADQSQVFTVTTTDVYGNSWNATSSASFTENDPTGSFTANTYNAGQVGSWTIYATVNGVNSNNVTANVSHGIATGITVTPDSTTVVAGGIVTYTVTARDADANTWNVTTLSSFNITAGAGGSWNNNVYTSANAGTWTVTGTYGTLTDTASLTVSLVPAVLTTITINPNTAQTIIAGGTLQFTATGYDQFGNPITGLTFTWTGTNSSGLFNNTTAGIYAVRASSGGINSSDTYVTVNSGVLANWLISNPGNQIAGISFTISITPRDQYNNVITNYNWSNPVNRPTISGLNSIGSHTPNYEFVSASNGVAIYRIIPYKAETVSLTVTLGSITKQSTSFTVAPSSILAQIFISPFTDLTITSGQTVHFIANSYDNYGNLRTGDIFTWTGTNSSGVFNNTTPGSYSVYAAYGGITSNHVQITVVANDNKSDDGKKSPDKTSSEQKTETKIVEKTVYQTKWISTAKAADTDKKKEETKEEPVIEEPEIITEITPDIGATTTEKTSRNWWIPLIIVILVLMAAYYGYIALSDSKSDEKKKSPIVAMKPEKEEDTEISKKNLTDHEDTDDTQEIKPINDDENKDKTRW